MSMRDASGKFAKAATQKKKDDVSPLCLEDKDITHFSCGVCGRTHDRKRVRAYQRKTGGLEGFVCDGCGLDTQIGVGLNETQTQIWESLNEHLMGHIALLESAGVFVDVTAYIYRVSKHA